MPPVHQDRGHKIYAVPPLVQHHLTMMPSQRPTTLCAISGAPVLPYLNFQEGHSGRYFVGFSHCLAPTGSSLAEKGPITSSHQCVEGMLTNLTEFVKIILQKAFLPRS